MIEFIDLLSCVLRMFCFISHYHCITKLTAIFFWLCARYSLPLLVYENYSPVLHTVWLVIQNNKKNGTQCWMWKSGQNVNSLNVIYRKSACIKSNIKQMENKLFSWFQTKSVVTLSMTKTCSLYMTRYLSQPDIKILVIPGWWKKNM